MDVDAAAAAAGSGGGGGGNAAAGAVAAAGTTGDEDSAGNMSAAHRTALAKLPDAIDWLLAALGGWGGSSSSGSDGDGAAATAGSGRGPARGPGAKGPIVPAWKGGGSSNSNGGSGSGGTKRPAAAAAVGELGEARCAKRSALNSCNSTSTGVSREQDASEEEQDDEEGGDEQQGCGGSGFNTGPKFLVFAHHRLEVWAGEEAVVRSLCCCHLPGMVFTAEHRPVVPAGM